ncbi:MAG TPA: glycosyltransferase [Rhizorhapis sp.]|nr:glycosyltransferase [Rhizorhapis sp.]
MYQAPRSSAWQWDRRAARLAGAGVIKLHRVKPLGMVAFGTFLATSIFYFAYRLPLWNPEAPILASLLLLAELFGVFTLVLHVFSTWTLVERQAPPPPAGYEADIFITTWNESVDILRCTLLAAKQVSHARAIWLLDDGCRPEMEALARELQVKYVARQDRSHAKAGNLNNALTLSDAPFVAIFDCDHAPSPDFLERTLGYFMDPSVSFVQTPQDFYNVDSFQHRGSAGSKEAWHEQTLFYRAIQPGKDRWNATFFCGSCAVIRRQALEDIGGFATGTITEDMHTSLRLHKNGWSAVYHAEALAFGLSPANLEQYSTQRLRWGRGAMQVWAKEGILFRGRLTLAQRIAYLTSTITYFEGWQKAIVYILPILVLATGSMPIIWTGWQFLLVFAAWLLSGMVVNEIFSRGYAKTVWTEEYNFLRFATFIKATLALILPIKWQFSVTPKGLQGDLRLPISLWPQMLVAVGGILSMLIGAYRFHEHHYMPDGAFVANIFWVAISSVLAIKALRFATGRLSQRRSEHRFPVPLIARVTSRDGSGRAKSRYCIARDVSSLGMSLDIRRGHSQGDVVEGELILPAGPISFRAKVMRRFAKASGQNEILGLQFDWPNPAAADALNACLYGNALQWDVNGWAETRRRPWRSLWPFAGRNSQAIEETWEMGHLAIEGKAGAVCLVRNEDGIYRVLSYANLPATSHLKLRVDGHCAASDLQLAGYRQYSIGGSPLQMAVLADSRDIPALFHREPAWTAN